MPLYDLNENRRPVLQRLGEYLQQVAWWWFESLKWRISCISKFGLRLLKKRFQDFELVSLNLSVRTLESKEWKSVSYPDHQSPAESCASSGPLDPPLWSLSNLSVALWVCHSTRSVFAETQCLSPQGWRSLIDKSIRKNQDLLLGLIIAKRWALCHWNGTEFNLRKITLNDVRCVEGDVLDAWSERIRS